MKRLFLTLIIGLPACLLFDNVVAGLVAHGMGATSHG